YLFRVVFVFFFFQAEDGIRDLTVTGVQTCALPIYLHGLTRRWVARLARNPATGETVKVKAKRVARITPLKNFKDAVLTGKVPKRSEERRVGKEGRDRWGAEAQKKEEERDGEGVEEN